MNAAAGRAAASVGARLNRAPVTPKVLRIGALAGITKSALTTFYEVVSRMGVNLAFSILLLLVFSSFGISLILTAEVCNSTMDKGMVNILINRCRILTSCSAQRTPHCGSHSSHTALL